MTELRRVDLGGLWPGVGSALLCLSCLCSVGVTHAQTVVTTPRAAQAGGPAWSALTPAQQSALAPLKKDWPALDAPRKQKWLELSARMPSMSADERQRIQDRMTEWARLSPEERGRARLQFQEARQISPQERQARWDAYLALPVDERRALADRAKTVPKAGTAELSGPAGGSTAASVQKNNLVTAPSTKASVKTVAPTVVQAKPGASTTLISKTATPPPHTHIGQPKIAVGKDQVNRSTLLPQAGPQGPAVAASAAQ